MTGRPYSGELAIKPDGTALLVVDVQEKLVAAVPEPLRAPMLRNLELLLEGARMLGLKTFVTEQYPKGLGPTLSALRERLDAMSPAPQRFEKLAFDACGAEGLVPALRTVFDSAHSGQGQAPAVVVAGMEAHICVYQSARGLAQAGFRVQVPIDAVCSRSSEDRRIAEGLLSASGAVVTSTETVLFDLFGRAGSEEFKAFSRLLR
ncbi:MAG: isochorismatase family protein [Proteobacteria bacterium]|nr:isochorismatase family protein [Pseudomonadota bacterium]